MRTQIATAAIIFALIFGISNTLTAQKPKHNGEGNNERFEQMQKFQDDNIQPQLKIWKDKIDNSVSAADKKELDKLREKSYKLRAEMLEDMQDMRDDDTKRSERREKMKKVRDKHQDEMAEIREATHDILDKYDVLAKEIRVEATAFKKEVKEDLYEKREEYRNGKEGHGRGRNNGKGMNRGNRSGNRLGAKSQLGEVGIWLYSGKSVN